MFMTSGPPPLGGYGGFVSPSRFLRTVTGNPAVLARALAKPLRGVTVYGAAGGVGDETVNLFDTANILKRLVRNSQDSISITDSNSITVVKTRDNVQERPVIIIPSPGTNMNITLSSSGSTVNLLGMCAFDTLYDSVSALEAVYGNTTSIYSKTINTGQSPYIGIRIGNISQATTGTWAITNIKIKEGNEAYGYKIPVFVDSNNLAVPPSSLPALQNGITFDYKNGVYTAQGTSTAVIRRGFVFIKINPSTQYTYVITPINNSEIPSTCIWDSTNNKSLLGYGQRTIGNFTTGSTTTDVSVAIYIGSSATSNYSFKVMVVEGSYTAETMPPYIDKTINLFTPQQLTNETDAFAVNIPAKTATLTAGGVSTDVSDMQDWEQDFALVRGDNTASIGTAVQPSAVEWRYLSSRRG